MAYHKPEMPCFQDVSQIRDRRKKGFTVKDIADELSLSIAQVKLVTDAMSRRYDRGGESPGPVYRRDRGHWR